MRVPRCGHPDRPHFAFWKCAPCYTVARRLEALNRPPATCHPDRMPFRDGLCRECFATRSQGGARRVDAILAAATYGTPCRCPVPLVRVEDGLPVCRLCSNQIRTALRSA